MQIAALQMVSTPDVDRNLDAAERLVTEAARRGARLVALPEYFCLMGRSDRDKLQVAERPGEGPMQDRLAAVARRCGVWLIGGTLPVATGERDAQGQALRVLNRCTVWGPDGGLVAHYDKIHRFAFDNGQEAYDESRVLDAGTQPVAFQADGLRVGLSICYDLRFPELYRALMRPMPCDLLVVPSAFTWTTGQAHWSLLLRARAVENQCYGLAPAQGGRHENGRRTWGHSLVADAWGEVLACQAEGEAVVMAEASAAHLAQVRQQLPALQHRVL